VAFGADGGRRADAAVAPLALLVGEHRFYEMLPAEVRPQRVGDVDLRVCDLPEQVVAHAHLTARPNQQIRIRLTGGVEKTRKALFVEILWPDTGGHRSSGGIDNLGPAAVIQRDVEQHPTTAGGALHRRVQFVLDIRRQIFHPSDHTKADVVSE